MLLIFVQLYTRTIPARTTTLPSPTKTPTYSSTRSRRGTRSAISSLTLLLITSTPGSAITTTSIEYIGAYLAIAISIYINIVYKRVTNIAKDV